MNRVLAVGIQEHLGTSLQRLAGLDSVNLKIHETPDLGSTLEILRSGEEFQLIIACLSSHDLRALVNVQFIREQHQDIVLLVLFDVGKDSVMAQSTIRRLLATFRASSSAAPSPRSDECAAPPHGYDGRRSIDRTSYETAPHHLTLRQLEVLRLLKEGKSNKEIARMLKLSEGTVKVHCMAIFRALGVTNRTQAAIAAALGD